MNMTDFAIEVSGLRKCFKDHAALDGLDLQVPSGGIFGFTGRNGAGKTSTIQILMGMLRADAGRVRVLGSPKQIIRFTRPFFPRWRDDLEKLSQNVRTPAGQEDSRSLEGHAFEADALAGDFAWRRFIGSGRADRWPRSGLR